MGIWPGTALAPPRTPCSLLKSQGHRYPPLRRHLIIASLTLNNRVFPQTDDLTAVRRASPPTEKNPLLRGSASCPLDGLFNLLEEMFAGTTYRALPFFRQFLKRRPGRYLAFSVTLRRIVDITTICGLTLPHFHRLDSFAYDLRVLRDVITAALHMKTPHVFRPCSQEPDLLARSFH